jgi:hypothetical protein
MGINRVYIIRRSSSMRKWQSRRILFSNPGQRFARVYRDDGTPAIFVAKKVMATPDASNLKAALRQGGDQFGAGDPWASAHAAMVTR